MYIQKAGKVTRGKSFANSSLLGIPVEKFRDSNNALLIPWNLKCTGGKVSRYDD